MRVTSLGYRTDLALRALEGGTETDWGDYLVVRNPALPDFWWGSFLLLARPGLAAPPGPPSSAARRAPAAAAPARRAGVAWPAPPLP
jgi:hypothetical protein